MKSSLPKFAVLALAATGLLSACGSSGSTSSDSSSSSSPWNSSIAYGTLTDARDGQTYRTVKIGTQTWMAQNLNYAGTSAASVGVWYNNSADSGAKYGRLYTWAEAVAGHASSATNPSGVQGACPAGWHVPSDTEWSTLTTFVGGAASATPKLMSTGGWLYSGFGLDNYGFRALPAGIRNADGTFTNAGLYTTFWSTTEDIATTIAWSRMLALGSGSVLHMPDDKTKGFSLRCLAN